MKNLSDLPFEIRRTISAANLVDANILITGATGTGKTRLAGLIHQMSPKRENSRIHKINLATLSENLMESELFGHERGAFTGADSRRVGRLELCNGGTVILDEIGDLSLRLQSKLLDFIQFKKILPVGSNKEIDLDVRIIAVTNKNLEDEVAKGNFREDLYHRLNVFRVEMQELKNNKNLVLQLAKDFLEKKQSQQGFQVSGLSEEVIQIFITYTWPGNVRELENTLEFACAMESRDYITKDSLPTKLRDFAPTEKPEEVDDLQPLTSEDNVSGDYIISIPISLSFHESKAEFEKRYFDFALRQNGGRVNQTCKTIGISKATFSEKMERFKIDWRKYTAASNPRTIL